MSRLDGSLGDACGEFCPHTVYLLYESDVQVKLIHPQVFATSQTVLADDFHHVFFHDHFESPMTRGGFFLLISLPTPDPCFGKLIGRSTAAE